MRFTTAGRRRAVRLALAPAALACLLSGCAARRFTPPTDAGTPLGDLAQVEQQVFRACSGVKTLQGELALSGRVGEERLRGPVHAGFVRPASMRLEGVAPFGAPVFILVTRGDATTLLLPRAGRVVRGDRPDEILGALTGIPLAPADLLAILTGCVVPSPRAVSGRLYANGTASLDLGGGATLYLRRQGTAWRPVAAQRADWTIEYPAIEGAFPGAVRLRLPGGAVPVDVTARLSQLETNTVLEDAVFTVPVPADAAPMTIEELRDAGPLRGTQ